MHVLIALHKQNLPDMLPISPHVSYHLPIYDTEALMVEVELLLDWYLPHRKTILPPTARENYLTLWRTALLPLEEAPRCRHRCVRGQPGAA